MIRYHNIAAEGRKFAKQQPFVDKVPPKSTYSDTNRSDIVMSKTFKNPSEATIKKLRPTD